MKTKNILNDKYMNYNILDAISQKQAEKINIQHPWHPYCVSIMTRGQNEIY